MILMLQKQTNFLISCLRRDRLNCLTIVLYYLLISGRIRSSTNIITLLLILLMIAEFFRSIFRGLFSKGSLNLIRLEKWRLMIILSRRIRTWLMLSYSKGRLKFWHQLRQEKLERLIQRLKYRLMNIKKFKGVVTNKRADMSRKKHREMGRWDHVLHLEFCWINGNGRRKMIISVG